MKKKSKLNFVIRTILFLVLASYLVGQIKVTAEAKETARVGSHSPNFTLSNLDGKEVKLSDYKGKVVFLNFWATWCRPCRYEMPFMENLKSEMNGYDFVILAVSVDRAKTEKIKEFIKNNGYTFEVFHDSSRELHKIYQHQNQGIPTTYIIDKDGIIIEVSVGAEKWNSKERLSQFKALSPKSKTKEKSTNKEKIEGKSDKTNTKKDNDIVSKASASDFVGHWINRDPNTRGITRVKIRAQGKNIYVHMWGRCHPYDCDWDEETTNISDALDGKIELKWNHGFAVRNQELYLLSESCLKLIGYTHFTDNSGRSDYDSVYYFIKQ